MVCDSKGMAPKTPRELGWGAAAGAGWHLGPMSANLWLAGGAWPGQICAGDRTASQLASSPASYLVPPASHWAPTGKGR